MSDEKFSPISGMTTDLHECYQVQYKDNQMTCVLIGRYKEIPLPVIKVLDHTYNDKKYKCNIVSYIMTKEEIENELFKMVGVVVMHDKNDASQVSTSQVGTSQVGTSQVSLDFVYDKEENNFELLVCDHKTEQIIIVEKIEKFPGKDKIVDFVVNKLSDPYIAKVLFTRCL